MISDDIATLERELSVTLPSSYHNVMLAYPFPSHSPPAQAYIPDNLAAVRGLNIDLRVHSDYISFWRQAYFAMGTNFGGDAYFIDTNEHDSPVFKAERRTNRFSKVESNFSAWIARLKKWYVDFNPDDVEPEYAEVRQKLELAGCFATSIQPMDGWHRISVASKRRPGGGLTGNSFWISHLGHDWYAGAWGGSIYQVRGNVSEFCIDWLLNNPEGTRADFDMAIKAKHDLHLLADGAFARVIAAS